MSEELTNNEEMFECKMYITDLETNKSSKEINVSDLVFNDWIEFEFGNYEDEDYGTLPYKDFKFFINDYSVTFYSPQYQKAIKEIENLKNQLKQKENIIKEVREYINKAINEGYDYQEKDNLLFESLEILDKNEVKK